MSDLLEFTDENFETEVLNSSEPVFVDFYTPTCGPCRQLLPTVQELASESDGAIKFGKMDIASNMQTASKYQVMVVPTLMIFRDGEPQDGVMRGVQSKAVLQQAIDAVKA